MTMGDRVALMRRGKLQQVAPPQIIYRDPVNLFVASFIGSPSMNFVRAEIVAEKDLPLARCADVDIPVLAENVALRAYLGKTVALGVRPEDLHLASGDPAPRVSGVVVLTEVLGSKMLAHVEVAGGAGCDQARHRRLTRESRGLRRRSSRSARLVAVWRA
jgi:multiple sugar transport system ATP-binding protein